MIKLTPFLLCALLAKSSFAFPAPFRGVARDDGATCPANVISCGDTSGVDSCCVETPGGQLVQTQFWDFDPSTGPSDSWTIHGLWPDHCDGTFDSGCDSSRNYPSIRNVLSDNGKSDLLDFMDEFWVDINGKNEQFWSHEWNKHGTCMSTIAPSCMPDGSNTGLDAAYYFQMAVDAFKTLGTYEFLSNAGIVPDESTTYTLDQLTSAIEQAHGFIPALDCKSGSLNAISYYFNLQGTVMNGNLVAFDAPKAGSCPQSGIKYLPKSN